jgi:hypothetical protein
MGLHSAPINIWYISQILVLTIQINITWYISGCGKYLMNWNTADFLLITEWCLQCDQFWNNGPLSAIN